MGSQSTGRLTMEYFVQPLLIQSSNNRLHSYFLILIFDVIFELQGYCKIYVINIFYFLQRKRCQIISNTLLVTA